LSEIEKPFYPAEASRPGHRRSGDRRARPGDRVRAEAASPALRGSRVGLGPRSRCDAVPSRAAG